LHGCAAAGGGGARRPLPATVGEPAQLSAVSPPKVTPTAAAQAMARGLGRILGEGTGTGAPGGERHQCVAGPGGRQSVVTDGYRRGAWPVAPPRGKAPQRSPANQGRRSQSTAALNSFPPSGVAAAGRCQKNPTRLAGALKPSAMVAPFS
jgi:hypothetical protein